MKANYFTYYLQQQTKIASLVVFRMFFGIMMFASIVRFWANGWIEELYLQPKFHFKYYFFSWVQPLGNYTYLLFILCALILLCHLRKKGVKYFVNDNKHAILLLQKIMFHNVNKSGLH